LTGPLDEATQLRATLSKAIAKAKGKEKVSKDPPGF